MKSYEFFELYMKQEINLNDHRMSLLQDRIQVINRFLKVSSTGDIRFSSVIPQGSYARKTIIKPRQKKEFDADVLVPMSEIENWKPQEYLDYIYNLFRSNEIYKDKVSIKKRCIVLKYSDDFHIDILPYITREDGKTYIVNYRTREWELHNPRAYNYIFSQINRSSSGKLVKTIKILKFIRELKSIEMPSFILSSIILNALKDKPGNNTQDLSQYIIWVFEMVSAWMKYQGQNPYIDDYDGKNLLDRLGIEKFSSFCKEWNSLKNDFNRFVLEAKERDFTFQKEYFEYLILKTSSESKPIYSGTIPGVKAKEKAPLEEFFDKKFPLISRSVNYKPAELFFEDLKFNYSKNKIYVRKQTLTFRIKGIVLDGTEKFYWKVRNTGLEAKKQRQERGQITITKSHIHDEYVKFLGKHWVEVWVVKNNKIFSYASINLDFVNPSEDLS